MSSLGAGGSYSRGSRDMKHSDRCRVRGTVMCVYLQEAVSGCDATEAVLRRFDEAVAVVNLIVLEDAVSKIANSVQTLHWRFGE